MQNTAETTTGTAAARAEVNRANAAHSTGPRTEEGKAISSRNAITHGLTSAQIVIGPGEQQAFDALLEGLTQELIPQGALEQAAFDDIVHAVWQKRRIRLTETKFLDANPDLMLDPAAMAQVERYRRYHGYYDRLYNRALRHLAELQRIRQQHTALQAEAKLVGETLAPESLLIPPAPKPRTRVHIMADNAERSAANAQRLAQASSGLPLAGLASFRKRLARSARKPAA